MEQRPFPILCIGGALADRRYRLKGKLVPGSSNPAIVTVGFGGVARNVAENLARLGATVALAAAVGDDDAGRRLAAELAALGVDVALVQPMPAPTAEYAAIIDGETGALHLAAVSMDAAEAAMETRAATVLAAAPDNAIVLADANLSSSTLAAAMGWASASGRFLALDAVSVAKTARLRARLNGVGLIKMNRAEAAAYLEFEGPGDELAGGLRRRGAQTAVVTGGASGAWLADARGIIAAPAFQAAARDTTGAGDALLAAMLWRISLGETPRAALPWGVAAAALSTETDAAVHTALTPAFLASELTRRRRE
jgi:pseudouridine kinase